MSGQQTIENQSINNRENAVLVVNLRDYFAAAALTGLLGNSEFHVETDVESEIPNAIAKYSYEAADAMIRAREAK